MKTRFASRPRLQKGSPHVIAYYRCIDLENRYLVFANLSTMWSVNEWGKKLPLIDDRTVYASRHDDDQFVVRVSPHVPTRWKLLWRRGRKGVYEQKGRRPQDTTKVLVIDSFKKGPVLLLLFCRSTTIRWLVCMCWVSVTRIREHYSNHPYYTFSPSFLTSPLYYDSFSSAVAENIFGFFRASCIICIRRRRAYSRVQMQTIIRINVCGGGGFVCVCVHACMHMYTYYTGTTAVGFYDRCASGFYFLGVK